MHTQISAQYLNFEVGIGMNLKIEYSMFTTIIVIVNQVLTGMSYCHTIVISYYTNKVKH